MQFSSINPGYFAVLISKVIFHTGITFHLPVYHLSGWLNGLSHSPMLISTSYTLPTGMLINVANKYLPAGVYI